MVFLFDMKSVRFLQNKYKVCRRAKGIIGGEEIFRQPHRSGILVPLYSAVPAPAVFVPVQANLLEKKRGQMFFSFSFLNSHG